MTRSAYPDTGLLRMQMSNLVEQSHAALDFAHMPGSNACVKALRRMRELQSEIESHIDTIEAALTRAPRSATTN